MIRRLCQSLVIVVATLAVASGRAEAQEPIRFARTPDISPDGKLVAFSYLGDIWIVEAIGGVARHVSMHEKHEIYPSFSPDGKQLAFSSNRHGSYDVFVVPVHGGRPRRLTFDSADDYVNGWSPDGKRVLFSSARSTSFPFSYGLFTVAMSGGRAERIGVTEGREGVFSPRGDEVAYVSGPGTWYRKGYRGSSNDDIWMCKADGSNHRRATQFNGQDTSPMWSPDGRFLYYVSEHFGTPANIVRQDLGDPKSALVQLTQHKNDGVRHARLSGNGDWIVYECGADLWVLSTRTGSNRKLAIEVHADDKSNPERVVYYTNRGSEYDRPETGKKFAHGASEYAISHDEKQIALVVHGQIFLMPRGGGKAKRLSDGPDFGAAYNHGLAWSPDGKKILFLSDSKGQEDMYLLESDDPDTKELLKAHRFKIKQLTNTPEGEIGVNFSPDGKRISFLRASKLYTMNPDGSDLKVIVNEGEVFDYEWSPDSKMLCYARQDAHFASELYLIPATGATPDSPARNITRFATYNGGVTWSKTGNRLAFVSLRRKDQPTLCVLSLQKASTPGAATSSEIDWDDIHLRVAEPTSMTVLEAAIANDGSRVAFRGRMGSSDDLWVANSDGGQITRLTTGNQRPTQIQWSRLLSSLVYFRDGEGTLRMATVGGSGAVAVPFVARITISRDEEFAEMFEQSWRALRENFYDPNFHGADWNRVRDKFRPLVKHCILKEDLYALISLMMGELNASHLSIYGFLGRPEQTTAELGLLYDPAYRGPGLKVAEILKRGPADLRGLNLKPGDLILAIDRVALNDKTDISQLLNDKAGETVSLQVTSNPADPKASRFVNIKAVARGQVANLMYERWVTRNFQRVTELSKGKLGYIHIPDMVDTGLDRFLRSLYSDNYDKDAIIIDVRFNGGGYTHEQILNYLGGKEHTYFRQRHGGQGLVLNYSDRKWTRPMLVLINNRSYSDAEIFPHAFRTMGLGKLVGQPTGGHVIGTRGITLIDGSNFRVPRIGVSTVKGVNMEKEGVIPDVHVESHPDQLAKGIDPQLDRAVEVLTQDVIAWRKSRGATASAPTPGGSGPSPVVGPGNTTPTPVTPKKN
ncbi:MAG: PDZ domain-containing protein [Planctomycetes bacterium]|nr:PDZ domain-containing protein [Planctomycetota bacterium]